MTRKLLFAACLVFITSTAIAEDQAGAGKRSRDGLKEPLLRVAKNRLEPAAPEVPAAKVQIKPAGPGEHPLDPAIVFAKDGLQRIRATIDDYSCTVVKQERINGELYPQEYMYAEIRNRKVDDAGRLVVPFSVYLYFLKPEKMKGREVAYVEGQNDGCLWGKEGQGIIGVIGPVALRPDSNLAMRGNRYPITEIGLENLVAKLIEKGERDRVHGECTVQTKEGVKINGRGCTLLTVVHPVPRPHFEFNIANVYIDDELNLPVRYEAYTWPKADGKPVLEECYTYLNLKINQGLKDENFSKERLSK
jgi:hypothetical protein